MSNLFLRTENQVDRFGFLVVVLGGLGGNDAA